MLAIALSEIVNATARAFSVRLTFCRLVVLSNTSYDQIARYSHLAWSDSHSALASHFAPCTRPEIYSAHETNVDHFFDPVSRACRSVVSLNMA